MVLIYKELLKTINLNYISKLRISSFCKKELKSYHFVLTSKKLKKLKKEINNTS